MGDSPALRPVRPSRDSNKPSPIRYSMEKQGAPLHAIALRLHQHTCRLPLVIGTATAKNYGTT